MNSNPIELTDLLLDGRSVTLTLTAGRIAAITPATRPAQAVILPLPIDPHVHLDKTHTARRCRAEKPGLFGAIEVMERDKPNWTADDLRDRIASGIADAHANGVAAIRSHVDWSTPDAPLAWAILAEAAQDWSGCLAVQRASLSPLDLLGDPDFGPAIAARVAADAEVLGCFVYRNANLSSRLNQVFKLAVKHDLRLDFHVDEGLEPEASGFDEIVRLTALHRLSGRVLCGHACSLSIRPADDVARALAAAAVAGVALTVLPTTNLYIQDMTHGRTPRLRGLAPLQEARAAGVEVLLGCDNVRDPFYPYGSYDPVEMLRLAALVGHLDPGDWLDAISVAPAKAMGLPSPHIAVGKPADFLVIEGSNWTEALASPRATRHLFRAGRTLPIGKVAA